MSTDAQLAFDTVSMRAAEINLRAEQALRLRYLEAIADLDCPWARIHPRHRFKEYDDYRAIWADEIFQWLYDANPREIHSLTDLAWKVQHARISDGGYKTTCLNWSDRNQRVYLGDGLLQYLGLLCDDARALWGNDRDEPQPPKN